MALALVDTHPRPALRLIQGGLGARPTPAVYRRRRVVALVLAVAFVVVAMAGVQAAVRSLAGEPGGRPLSATEGSAPVPAGHETVLVQPGDTLWTIARDLQPTGDLRSTVDLLAALNGGPSLEVGQTLVLPH
jgi:predicted Zn-dependent protease